MMANSVGEIRRIQKMGAKASGAVPTIAPCPGKVNTKRRLAKAGRRCRNTYTYGLGIRGQGIGGGFGCEGEERNGIHIACPLPGGGVGKPDAHQ